MVQGQFRESSLKVQGSFREGSGRVHESFEQLTRTLQCMFKFVPLFGGLLYDCVRNVLNFCVTSKRNQFRGWQRRNRTYLHC